MKKTTDYRFVAGRLRAAMRNRKIRASELFVRLNGKYSRETIADYLDARKTPSDDFIEEVAKILGINIAYFKAGLLDPPEVAALEGNNRAYQDEWDRTNQVAQEKIALAIEEDDIFNSLL